MVKVPGGLGAEPGQGEVMQPAADKGPATPYTGLPSLLAMQLHVTQFFALWCLSLDACMLLAR